MPASFLFWHCRAAISNAWAQEDSAPLSSERPEQARALAEKTGLLPAQTYAAIYPEFKLPKSDFKPIIPEKKTPAAELNIFASSSLAVDKRSNTVLWAKDSSARRPIASLTKLMTALVFLDAGPDWEKFYQLQKEDVRPGGKSYIYPGDEVKVTDLFYLVLVGSDNTAAVALARSLGLTEAEFVAKMNAQALNFRLENTYFQDISGLSGKNVSTAEEVAVLANRCLARESIRAASLEEKYEFKTAAGRPVTVESTDYLLSAFPVDGINILGGKTGHTEEAGYCFVGDFENEAGQEIISVVMGTNSNEDRFAETKKLVKWVYDSYDWRQSGQ